MRPKGASMNYNSNSENLLWIVTEDNKIAVFRPEDFKQINRKKGDHTFELRLIDQTVQNEEEIRKILQF